MSSLQGDFLKRESNSVSVMAVGCLKRFSFEVTHHQENTLLYSELRLVPCLHCALRNAHTSYAKKKSPNPLIRDVINIPNIWFSFKNVTLYLLLQSFSRLAVTPVQSCGPADRQKHVRSRPMLNASKTRSELFHTLPFK